jgi:glycerol uptake facilitator-like aquaporin
LFSLLLSGGHFNPAVSLGIALSGKMNPLVTVFYWAAQLGGGFCGALIVRVCFMPINNIQCKGISSLKFVTNQQQYDSIAGGATIVPNGQLWYQASL